MPYRNGAVPATALTTIAPGVQLVNATARAYRVWRAVAAVSRVSIEPAPGVGSGYRSFAVQTLFFKASHGDQAAARAVDLSTSSIIRIADPGQSSHGTGTRLDVLVNGSDSPVQQHIDLAATFGWTREFGADDPNHFMHDGRTSISGPTEAQAVRVVCAYLNARYPELGSDAWQDGRPGKKFWLLVQHAGHADSVYPGYCKEDGDPAEHTFAAFAHYRTILFA